MIKKITFIISICLVMNVSTMEQNNDPRSTILQTCYKIFQCCSIAWTHCCEACCNERDDCYNCLCPESRSSAQLCIAHPPAESDDYDN
jgi:hypothetical protein